MRNQNNQDDEFDQKQWKQIIVEPSEMPKIAKGPPVNNLQLNWVYGFRCHDVRNCLRYNSESQILFYAGNTVVRCVRACVVVVCCVFLRCDFCIATIHKHCQPTTETLDGTIAAATAAAATSASPK